MTGEREKARDWSDEARKAVWAVEDKYDIEVVSIEHHEAVLTQARHSALLEAAAIARERSAISHDGAKQYPDGSPERRSETCAGIEAEHIACLIEQAAKEK